MLTRFCNIGCLLDVGDLVSAKGVVFPPSSLQVHGPRTRVPSYHMRELTKGRFLVSNEDITLLDCIGEGVHYHTCFQ